MRTVIIYALSDPRTDLVRYVGKTVKMLEKRFNEHLKDKSDIRKCRWIADLRKENLTPEVYCLEVANEYNWQVCERKWIKFYRDPSRSGNKLCNHTDGGDGLVNPTWDTRLKMSLNARRNMANPLIRAKIFTIERANNISKALTGKTHSAEHISKLPQNQKGFKPNLTAERRKQLSDQAIYQNSIRIYKPLSEATRKILSEKSLGNKSRTGMTNSVEMKEAVGNFFRGRPKTELQKQRMRDSALKRWAAKRLAA